MSDRVESETELIETYLAPLAAGFPGAFGLKDDAALFDLPSGTELVVTTDPIIEDIHFFASDRADDIAWKALAVNLSDLAAKGAEPFAYTMALAFPRPPEKAWMARFAEGLFTAQATFGCHLAGGDTDHTSGPLSISITAFGIVPAGKFVRRTTARCGDNIYVTGTLGDAALGLALNRDASLLAEDLSGGDRGLLTARYLRPHPRTVLAPVLRTYASAGIDISDGLVKDLSRLVAGAGGGADIRFADLPLSGPARNVLKLEPRFAAAVISGGGDYEILFAAAPENETRIRAECEALRLQVTRIATIAEGRGVRIRADNGDILPAGSGGYDHFAA